MTRPVKANFSAGDSTSLGEFLNGETLDNDVVSAGNVTQHQAALSINGSQIASGTVTDARLSANVALVNATPTFNPASAGAPFAVGVNGQGQLVAGLNADQLDGQEGSHYLDLANATGVLATARGGTGLSAVGTEGQILTVVSGMPAWANAPAGGSGEINTASSVGVGGVAVFKQKTGVDLEFRSINAASSRITVALDAANNEVDLDVAEGALSIAGSQLTGTIADARLSTNVALLNAAPTFNPTSAGAPFAVGVNGQGQLVAGLNADQLDGQEGSHYLDLANATGVLATVRGGTGLSTVGTEGQVLSVVGGVPAWANAAGGGGGFDPDVADTFGATHTFTVDQVFDTQIFIGDNANSKQTVGLTINQGANDDEILSFKSSDVIHGMSSVTENDTFLFMSKASAASGGGSIEGLAEGIGRALVLRGTADLANTSKNSTAYGFINAEAYQQAGTTRIDALTENGNLFAVGAGTSTKFIVDLEGDIWADGSFGNIFDSTPSESIEDAELLRALDVARSDAGVPGLASHGFDAHVRYSEQDLIDLKIIGGSLKPKIELDEEGNERESRGLVNQSRLLSLACGAIVQAHYDKLALAEIVEDLVERSGAPIPQRYRDFLRKFNPAMRMVTRRSE